jgi:endonuclease III
MELWGTILAAIGGGIPSVIAVILSNRSHDKVVDERIKNVNDRIAELSARVEKHNNLVERMAVVEQTVKAEHTRIDDLKSRLDILTSPRVEKVK